ncbi:Putative heavy-metal chelation [Dethiosulfatibacter aminovorans DSM 17477]|uniref:Putative heavy-metal chelation n=1 Tax=Dethiosulfatibacter aminovorans DSM 17477 TaxID=1121476 RepID=A0A1M6MTS3_9FIRM|nr:DUF364 domain-containing protein [Dethiosulfatibacter aminovorans]SHJ86871.1 Putative heavy-metal chelation [Dethiosulfatibacter aminovorans DSM 17477]
MKEISMMECIKSRFTELVKKNELMDENISVEAKVLTTVEAIGNPKRRDYPLIKGREKLMQAEFKGSVGQAFTDAPCDFKGTVREIMELELESNRERAIFIASVNAIMNFLGISSNTIHCKDEEPESCAEKLVESIKEKYGNPKITLVGYQPAFLENLSKDFALRVLDLDDEKVGTKKNNVLIENGEESFEDALHWCDLVVATGSTVVNDTLSNFTESGKPTLFFGTTISGPACLMGLERFCEYSK